MTTLYITPKAWRQIERAVRRNPLVETGGVLMGYQTEDQKWLITYASEPGPNAIHLPNSINFDDRYLSKLVRKLKRRGSGKWKYIGDWHSHTIKRLSPSRGDRLTVLEKVSEAAYSSESPIMLIVGLGKQNQIQGRGYIFTNSLREVQRIVLVEKQAQ